MGRGGSQSSGRSSGGGSVGGSRSSGGSHGGSHRGGSSGGGYGFYGYAPKTTLPRGVIPPLVWFAVIVPKFDSIELGLIVAFIICTVEVITFFAAIKFREYRIWKYSFLILLLLPLALSKLLGW